MVRNWRSIHHRDIQTDQAGKTKANNYHKSIEDEGWTRVLRKRSKSSVNQWKHFSDDPAITTYFVSNLTEEITANILWRVFESFGEICDSFVAKRKTNRSYTFGFVKFRNVLDPIQLESKMDATKWNGLVLNVNLSKFDRHHQPINYKLRQNQKKMKETRVEKPTEVDPPLFSKRYDGAKKFDSSRSYSDVCKGTTTAPKKDVKIISMDKVPCNYPSHCLGRSVLVKTKSFKELEAMRIIMNQADVADYTMAYLGGLYVLLIFKTKRAACNFLTDSKGWWKQYFETAEIWNGQNIKNERLARVQIYGVPIILRDDTTYTKICELTGFKVLSSNFSWLNYDNSVGECWIITNEGRIFEEVGLKYKGDLFTVWISELESYWHPNWGDNDVTANYNSFPASISPVEVEQTLKEQRKEGEKSDTLKDGTQSMEVEETIFSNLHGEQQIENSIGDRDNGSSHNGLGPNDYFVFGSNMDPNCDQHVGRSNDNSQRARKSKNTIKEKSKSKHKPKKFIPDLNIDVEDPFNLDALIRKIGIQMNSNKRKDRSIDWDLNESVGNNNKKGRRFRVEDGKGDSETQPIDGNGDLDEHIYGKEKGSTAIQVNDDELIGVDCEEQNEAELTEADLTIKVAGQIGIDLTEMKNQVIEVLAGEGEMLHKK